jgi:hypothetical protein
LEKNTRVCRLERDKGYLQVWRKIKDFACLGNSRRGFAGLEKHEMVFRVWGKIEGKILLYSRCPLVLGCVVVLRAARYLDS